MKLKILVLVVATIIGFAVYLFFTRSNPVVYRHVDEAPLQYSAFVILNPFREREPERQAEAVLQRLKDRNCHEALALQVRDSARLEYLCEREKRYPLKSWSLMDRKGDNRKTELVYTVNRTSGDGHTSSALAWIGVQNNGAWRAITYDTFY